MDYPLVAYNCQDDDENSIVRIADFSDEQTYHRLIQDYEQQLTELEVKIKGLKRI
jgi:hypothetical protein